MNLIILRIIFIFYIPNVIGLVSDNQTEAATDMPTTILNLNVTEPVVTEPSNVTAKPIVSSYWLARSGVIMDDLLNVQAIIVKDEDADTCLQGVQKSKKRYIMCAGSILTKNRILTSASCLHEALHMRHNVRAHLAVVIAPLKSTVQIIRVADYRIHPKHNTNPYSRDHARYNVALLSLICKIETVNYFKIELPNQSTAHVCGDDDCVVAIYKSTGHTSNVILQALAPYIPPIYRKRRTVNYESKIITTSTEPAKKIVKRSTDGSHFCAYTGTAVMRNNTQAAIVAASCDDRQPTVRWQYTDVYENKEWIQSILNNWNHSWSQENLGNSYSRSNITNGTGSKNCGNCVFNFYISIGCKEKGNCPDKNRTDFDLLPSSRQFWNTNKNSVETPLRRNIPKINSSYDIDPLNVRVSRFNNESLTDEFSEISSKEPENKLPKNTSNRSWTLKKPDKPKTIVKSKKTNVPKRIGSNREISNSLKRRHAKIHERKNNKKNKH